MKQLIIAGAGGFGCEVLDLAEAINELSNEWKILGFLDDTKDVGTEVFRGYRVIGTISDWVPKEDEFFSIGVSSPKGKEMIYSILKSKGANFATLVSPSVRIPIDMVIGEGCVITLAWIGNNVKLGRCVNVHGSMIGESTIDDFSTTTGFANIAGAKVGRGVFIGTHAAILNNVVVEDYAYVCAGSIVFTKVKKGSKVIGNPARKFEF